MSRPSPAWYAAMASLVGILFVPPLAAEELGTVVATGRVKAVDVALDARQQLRGQVVTSGGEPFAATNLSLLRHGEQLAQIEVDEEGKFVHALPSGGVYQLAAGEQLMSIRAWTAPAAPPGCATQLIVVRGDVMRGQGGRIPYTQVNPWLVAGVVAVAVAIPVVLSNHRSDRGDGS